MKLPWRGSRQPVERLDDRALVERAQAGDRSAFGQLYERHVERVYRYIHFRVIEPDLAEDLTHDVFLNAWRSLAGFEWQGDLRPWLLRAAHNRVANHWRSVGRRPVGDSLDSALDATEGAPQGRLAAALTSDEESALDAVSRALQIAGVEALLQRLSDAQRHVVALRFGQEMSVAETAELMGRSISAVKNLQYEALMRVRTLLEAAADTHEQRKHPLSGAASRSTSATDATDARARGRDGNGLSASRQGSRAETDRPARGRQGAPASRIPVRERARGAGWGE